jgi:hypothetical protein
MRASVEIRHRSEFLAEVAPLLPTGGLVAVDGERRVVTVVAMSYGHGIPHLPEEVNVATMFPWTYQRAVVDGVPLVMAVADQPPEAAPTAPATSTSGSAGSWSSLSSPKPW